MLPKKTKTQIKEVLAVDPKYFRPTEVDLLIGDPTKAKTKLGWECKYDLPSLVKEMMQSDLKLMQKDQYLKDGGYTTLNYFEQYFVLTFRIRSARQHNNKKGQRKICKLPKNNNN